MGLKRRIGIWLSHYGIIFKIIRIFNLVIFQWDKRQHDKKFGPLNPSLKFYVIRRDTTTGLLGLYLSAIVEINRGYNNDFIPIVDYQNYKTQYSVDFPVNGTYNAWEYYFYQPCKYTLEEVYKSCNVRLSGWTFSPPPEIVFENYDIAKIAPIKQYIRDIANEKIEADGIKNMIGILIRGTDYVKLQAGGLSIPPTPEQAAEKLDEFIAKYGERKIFLATEDANIYNFFNNRYGDLIYTTDMNLIKYSGQGYINENMQDVDMYKFGLDYLVKMICLSECMCLIASRTGGSVFARLLNNGRYVEDYEFDLGVY